MNLLLLVLALQNPDSLSVRFAGMTAITGYEQAVGDSLLALLPGSTRDRLGNVTVTLGRGAPKRLVACALDEIGYVVGNITDDGYITLRRVGGVRSPLFDQQIEGHRVTLFGRKGPVPGVVGVRSTHLTRGRPTGNEAPFTVDNASVDVGASSRDEVLALGIAMLTPVAQTKRAQRYGVAGALLAAPNAGRRAACAALASAALSRPRVRGTVVVAFTVQSLYDTAGMKAVVNLQGPFNETRMVTVPSKFGDTSVETVAMKDVDALMADVVKWIGGSQ